MSNKGRRAGNIKTLPRIDNVLQGVRICGKSWVQYRGVVGGRQFLGSSVNDTIETRIQVGENVGCLHSTSWRFRIYKEKGNGSRRAPWVAAVSYDGSIDVEVVRGVSHGWREPILGSLTTPLLDAMRRAAAHGAGPCFGRGGADWRTIRPFKVVFPWSNSREPNAKYSPFKLVTGFDLDSHGEFVSVWSGLRPDRDSTWEKRKDRQFATELGANALLEQEDGNRWFIAHRNGMQERDLITLDEFIQRVIDGAGETF